MKGVHSLFVIQSHRVNRIGYTRQFGRSLECKGTVVAYSGFPFLSFLCSDKDYSVTASHTVDGCCRIFQDGHVFDVFSVQSLEICHITWNTVNNHERRSHASDVEIVVVGSRLCRFLPYSQTCDTSGKHILRVLGLGLEDIVTVYSRD